MGSSILTRNIFGTGLRCRKGTIAGRGDTHGRSNRIAGRLGSRVAGGRTENLSGTSLRTAKIRNLLPLAAIIVYGIVSFVQLPLRQIGSRGVTIFDGADRVETFRLDDGGYGDHMKEGTSGDEIADYPITFQGRTLGPAFAADLSRAVQDPRTFMGPNDVSCEINPGIAFRVWRGRECVEVIICFHCQQMLVTTEDAKGRVLYSAYTEITFTRAKFLALAKEAFPMDKEIQSLK